MENLDRRVWKRVKEDVTGTIGGKYENENGRIRMVKSGGGMEI